MSLRQIGKKVRVDNTLSGTLALLGSVPTSAEVRAVVITTHQKGGYLLVMACELVGGPPVNDDALVRLCEEARRADPRMAQPTIHYSLLSRVVSGEEIDGWVNARQRPDLHGHPACIGTGIVVATGGGVSE